MNSYSPLDPQTNARVVDFGREIFSELGKAKPSSFNKNYWQGRMMKWSMQKPDLKLNLFRLVDVLPVLGSSEDVAKHLREYLSGSAAEIHPAFEWALDLSKNKFAAATSSFIVKQAVHQMAAQFIAGTTPSDALNVLRRLRYDRFSFTVDLLGEFCLSEVEAADYLRRYLDALDVFSQQMPKWPESEAIIAGHPGERSPVCISVKLSALYSQTGALNFAKSVEVLSEHLSTLARKAQNDNALIYVDAEDSGNNPIIYEVFKRVFGSDEFRSFPYPGIVVQAYSKSSRAIIEDLLEFSRIRATPIAIRLVKGAYWDLERILCLQNHWRFPLWERKEQSDACYEYLSRLLLDNTDLVLPAFGSHNIRSLSHACCYAETKGIEPTKFELQVLYGMAEPIAEVYSKRGYLVRMYVPLGEILPGMGYLVRRLIENTSNESFLRHTFFESDEIDKLLREPQLFDAPQPTFMEERNVS